MWPRRQRLGWDPVTSKPSADITPTFSEANGPSGFLSHLALTVAAQGCWALGRGHSPALQGTAVSWTWYQPLPSWCVL